MYDDIKFLEIDCPTCKWGPDDGTICPVCGTESSWGRINILDYIKSSEFDESEIEDLTIACPDCVNMTSDPQYCCTTCWQEGGDGRINVLSSLREDYPEAFV